MPAYDRAEPRTTPTGDDVNWQQEYAILNRIHTDRCDEYNWLVTKLEEYQQAYADFREKVNHAESIAQESHRLIIRVRNNLGMLYHRKVLNDIEWFNDLITEFKDKIHFDISPINANDYFTAKATIEIDGRYMGSTKDKHRIVEVLKDSIMNSTMRDTKINIDDIIISAIYHSDELTDNKEG
jgi:hypothetical protein